MNSEIKTDLSVSMLAANLFSILIVLPLIILLLGLYMLRWGVDLQQAFFLVEAKELLFTVVVIIIGIVVHELIHAVSWMVFGRKPRRAIHFSIDKNTGSPYTHCQEPLPVNAYRIGAFMPGLLLGILPALAGLATGSGWLLGFGLLFTAAAGGDFLILWLIRKVPSDRMVQDHPTRAGCYVI